MDAVELTARPSVQRLMRNWAAANKMWDVTDADFPDLLDSFLRATPFRTLGGCYGNGFLSFDEFEALMEACPDIGSSPGRYQRPDGPG